MSVKSSRFYRWLVLIASGSFMLQATGCDLIQLIQTGLLAAITGTTLYLAGNV